MYTTDYIDCWAPKMCHPNRCRSRNSCSKSHGCPSCCPCSAPTPYLQRWPSLSCCHPSHYNLFVFVVYKAMMVNCKQQSKHGTSKLKNTLLSHLCGLRSLASSSCTNAAHQHNEHNIWTMVHDKLCSANIMPQSCSSILHASCSCQPIR